MSRVYPEVRRDYEFNKSNELMLKPFLSFYDITFINKYLKGKSELLYFFLKPEINAKESFGFDREILCVYSKYPEIQSRMFEQINDILTDYRPRLDQMVCVFISDSDKLVEEIKEFTVQDSERVCIIPFSKSYLITEKPDVADLRNAFQHHMYKRDLFAIESPIHTDRAFFGREDIVIQFVDRIKNNQNTGIFGLRKIGKTSVLFAIQRHINGKDMGRFVYYDCSNPGFYKSHWQDCLKILAKEILQQTNLYDELIYDFDKADQGSVPQLFYDIIITIVQKVPENRLVIALDEVEWISFRTSPEQHWNTEFLPFWQTMRAIHQRTNGLFTFIISGVNPKCIEDESIGGYDNPLFALMRPYFLQPFDEDSVRTMLRTLGKYMGIKFDFEFYSHLIDTYGGHPFLVRHACSKISELITERPVTISESDFTKYKTQIDFSLQKYVRQILNVLAEWYPDEYETAVLLSKGKIEKVKQYLDDKPEFLEHLIGYGLVVVTDNNPKLSILILSSHLKKSVRDTTVFDRTKSEYTKDEIDEIRVEISRRRNNLEISLRVLIKTGLKFKYGNKRMDYLLKSLNKERREKLSRFGYDNVFKELFFNELIQIIINNWDAFQSWFNRDLKDIELWLKTINEFRIDGHNLLFQ